MARLQTSNSAGGGLTLRPALFMCVLLLMGACRNSGTYAKNLATPGPGPEEPPVWFWSVGDSGDMEIRVCLDEHVIYETSFVTRLTKRSSMENAEPETPLHFSFAAPRSILWQGYKDADETTARGQMLRGDVWQAGAESEYMILGISFCSVDSIHMNTLHIALPDKRSESVVAPGLRIVTAPRARPFTR